MKVIYLSISFYFLAVLHLSISCW